MATVESAGAPAVALWATGPRNTSAAALAVDGVALAIGAFWHNVATLPSARAKTVIMGMGMGKFSDAQAMELWKAGVAGSDVKDVAGGTYAVDRDKP